MNCKECGRTTKKISGVYYINGKWKLLKANFCPKHGSFITPQTLAEGLDVIPDTTNRSHIRPGLHVLIFQKEHQKLQKFTEGYVSTILTNSLMHSRGIKVRLTNGKVGRIQKILI